ncbi:hypothetical protein BsWGS_12117 [Bradybaena similaris]
MAQLNLHPDVHQKLLQTFDEKHLDSLLAYLTSPPMFTTLRFDTNVVDGETALETLFCCLTKQCEETQREMYDMFLHPSLSDCILIKNRGPHSLHQHQKEVIVDLACGMAVLRGAHVYKQGILGAPHSLRVGDEVSVYADLDAKCLKGLATSYYGRKLLVGNGVAFAARTDLFGVNSNKSSGIGVQMLHPVYEAPSLAEVSLAWVSAQNLPSIACVHALDPQKGELVLDMCAAPGGKTSHIAALMGNQGRVIALEKSKERAKRMDNLKSSCIEIYKFDSTKAVADDTDSSNGPPFPPGTFDRILIDAPCSALGQRPSYVNKMSLSQLNSFPVIQHQLLLAAVKLLKPGGVLVYSTCTITREENEDQVSRLLAKCSCMDLVAAPVKLGGVGLAGCDLTEEQRLKVQRFDPTSTESADIYSIDTIGFFIAKFVKKKHESDT